MLASSHEPLLDSPEYQAFVRFARLTATLRELNEQVRQIGAQIRALQPILLGYFGQGGYQLVKVEGFTMSPVREPWVYPAKGVDRQAVCEALKLAGLGRLVKEGYSTKSLTAYVRELEQHQQLLVGADPDALGDLLPAPLAQVLEVRPGFRLQVRASHKKTSRIDDYETETDEENEGDSPDAE